MLDEHILAPQLVLVSLVLIIFLVAIIRLCFSCHYLKLLALVQLIYVFGVVVNLQYLGIRPLIVFLAQRQHHFQADDILDELFQVN